MLDAQESCLGVGARLGGRAPTARRSDGLIRRRQRACPEQLPEYGRVRQGRKRAGYIAYCASTLRAGARSVTPGPDPDRALALGGKGGDRYRRDGSADPVGGRLLSSSDDHSPMRRASCQSYLFPRRSTRRSFT